LTKTKIAKQSTEPRRVVTAQSEDTDSPRLRATELRAMKRVAPIKRIRWQLGLSQEEFASRFEIPIGTLRDWEQGRSEPDKPARAYLKIIGSDPAFVTRALRGEGSQKSRSK
jgi:putative transcriptional regulator